jgi:hypothetical protein
MRLRNCADHAADQKDQRTHQRQLLPTTIPLCPTAQGILDPPLDQRQRLVGRLPGASNQERYLRRVVFRR